VFKDDDAGADDGVSFVVGTVLCEVADGLM
jgi:hypothetical protein